MKLATREPLYPDVTVDLSPYLGSINSGESVIEAVRMALVNAGHGDVCHKFGLEARQGDYTWLLKTVFRYVNVSNKEN